MSNNNAVDSSGVIPIGFVVGILSGFILWLLCKKHLDKQFALERQIRLGTLWFIVAFFLVAPITLSIMHTELGAFIGSFLFTSVESFFMILVQTARLRDRIRKPSLKDNPDIP